MRNRLPAMEQLVAFTTVALHGNFTRAAADLNLTQSAVSHQIRKLEAAVGQKLLARSTHGVTLTGPGKLLLDEISEPLRAMALAIDRCTAGGASKRLGVELDSGFAAAWLAPRLDRFHRRFPEVQLEHFYSIHLAFPAHVDVAIKWGDGRWPGYVSERLMGLHYTPMCAPDLLRGKQKLEVPSDLHRFVLLHDRELQDWTDWLQIAQQGDMAVRKGHVVNDTNVLMRMVASGKGIGLCALELAERSLANGELVAPFRDIVLKSRQAYFVVSKQHAKYPDHVERFISWVKKEVATYLDRNDRFYL